MCVIRLGSLSLTLDAAGVAWHEASRTLLLADLHLEKGAAGAARGAMLPPYDTRATLSALGAVLDRLPARRVVALGDSFHRAWSASTMDATDRATLSALMAGRAWLWLSGNHDPHAPEGLGGACCAEFTLEDVTLRHAPLCDGGLEIAGHLHPKARVTLRGRGVVRRCFVIGARCLLLPAFGAFTGGLDVRHAAFDALRQPATTLGLLGDKAVHRLPMPGIGVARRLRA